MVVPMAATSLSDVTPYILVYVYQCFEGKYHIHIPGCNISPIYLRLVAWLSIRTSIIRQHVPPKRR
jgi:hypothetical protein